MSQNELFKLIRPEFCVITGIEPFTNRIHKLIYSTKDQDHFVVIQDASNGWIVTILTLEYHRNLAWETSAKRLREAIHKAHTEERAKTPALPRTTIACDLVIEYMTLEKGHTRTHRGGIRFQKFPENLQEALELRSFSKRLLEMLPQTQEEWENMTAVLLFENETGNCLEIPKNELPQIHMQTASNPIHQFDPETGEYTDTGATTEVVQENFGVVVTLRSPNTEADDSPVIHVECREGQWRILVTDKDDQQHELSIPRPT